MTWYSILRNIFYLATLRWVSGGGGQESEIVLFVLICGIFLLIYVLCCVVISFYFVPVGVIYLWIFCGVKICVKWLISSISIFISHISLVFHWLVRPPWRIHSVVL